MAVNAYLTIDGRPGPSTSQQGAIDVLSFSGGASQTAVQPATVQVGETNMDQVATRLGISKQDLLTANPHIQDPANLKVGQEINIPTTSAPHSESSESSVSGSHHHHHHHAQELPNAPIGSSIEASVMKEKLDTLGTGAKRNESGDD